MVARHEGQAVTEPVAPACGRTIRLGMHVAHQELAQGGQGAPLTDVRAAVAARGWVDANGQRFCDPIASQNDGGLIA
jgi:hypothetical protein